MFVSSCFLLASCVCFIFLLWERGGTFNSLPVYPIFILFNLLLALILTSAVLSQSRPQCSREPPRPGAVAPEAPRGHVGAAVPTETRALGPPAAEPSNVPAAGYYGSNIFCNDAKVK